MISRWTDSENYAEIKVRGVKAISVTVDGYVTKILAVFETQPDPGNFLLLGFMNKNSFWESGGL